MSMSQNVSLPQIFLVGVGYCRESRSLAHVNSWDDTIESCLDRHDCIARCYAFRSCVAVAWAATPKSDHSQCRELGKPRCINYITYSGQLAGGTDSHAREYECLSRYAPLPVAPSLPPPPSPPRPPVRPPPAPVVRAPADITGIVSLAVCVLLLYLVLEAVRPMPLSREQEAAIRDVFRTFDKDRSGACRHQEAAASSPTVSLRPPPPPACRRRHNGCQGGEQGVGGDGTRPQPAGGEGGANAARQGRQRCALLLRVPHLDALSVWRAARAAIATEESAAAQDRARVMRARRARPV